MRVPTAGKAQARSRLSNGRDVLPDFLEWRDNYAKGANIQNLRRAELEKLPIPVPPPSEQERIEKLLDEADGLRKLRAQADRRTAALLPALFHEMFAILSSQRRPSVAF
jgi:restriction endonuclease S subunit